MRFVARLRRGAGEVFGEGLFVTMMCRGGGVFRKCFVLSLRCVVGVECLDKI